MVYELVYVFIFFFKCVEDEYIFLCIIYVGKGDKEIGEVGCFWEGYFFGGWVDMRFDWEGQEIIVLCLDENFKWWRIKFGI